MTLWDVVGWLGNACYFTRFLLQWLASERAGQTRTPHAFWHFSLAGALLMSAYSVHREQWVMLAGYGINGLLYVRNLWLGLARRRRRLGVRTAAALAGLAALVLFAAQGEPKSGPEQPLAWLVCAIVGQSIWSTRFLVQWFLSEKRGLSYLPPSFWWISLAGNGPLLAYAIHLGDPVYIAAFVPGPLVQIRNLMLTRPAPDEAPAA